MVCMIDLKQIIYASDSMKQAIDFINDLVSDLQELGIKNIEHDMQHNFIIVGNAEVRGISLSESCLCLKIHKAEYFIDGINMRNYKDASEKRLDWLVGGVEEVMMHFDINAKQLSGKDELIKILTENNEED